MNKKPVKSAELHLFDSDETIKWLCCRRLELKRELRRLRRSYGANEDLRLAQLTRARYLKRAIRSADCKLDKLRGKKTA